MKTRNLLITLGVAALATVNVMATDALLSPRAAEQQVKIAPGTSSMDPNLAATGLASASPRVLDSQVKIVAGKSTAVSPSLQCARHMSGTPKEISACADHPGADAMLFGCRNEIKQVSYGRRFTIRRPNVK